MLGSSPMPGSNATQAPFGRPSIAVAVCTYKRNDLLTLLLEALLACVAYLDGKASAFNTMISSKWLKDHPAIRFETSLGVVGGEDMVFRAVRQRADDPFFFKRGVVYENEPPSRATWGYQLYLFLWHGNSSYVASVNSGANPFKMFFQGANAFVRAMLRPVIRGFSGESLQLRYSLALALPAAGKMIGLFGVRVKHR